MKHMYDRQLQSTNANSKSIKHSLVLTITDEVILIYSIFDIKSIGFSFQISIGKNSCIDIEHIDTLIRLIQLSQIKISLHTALTFHLSYV